jgi:AcrR family transcriptional regulator
MAKKRNSQKSMQDLLEAAINVFAKSGPNAATVDEICDKAGLNKRMLYHYFGNKEKLYQQALSHIYQQFLSVDMSLSSMFLPVEKLIEMIVRRYYDFLYKHQNFVRLICYENLNYGLAAKKLKLKGQKAPIITALELALEKGKAEKKFRKGIDASELMVSILALCFFNFSNRYTMKEFANEVATTKPAIKKRVKHVVDLLLNGIMDNTKK